jgi:hypothetical protein
VLSQPAGLVKYANTLNDHVKIERFVSLRDNASMKAPDNEGAACFAIGCYNAAATMFRLCLDSVTRNLLPDEKDSTVTQPNRNQRYKLGYRLPWLFQQNKLPAELAKLADCIKENATTALTSEVSPRLTPRIYGPKQRKILFEWLNEIEESTPWGPRRRWRHFPPLQIGDAWLARVGKRISVKRDIIQLTRTLAREFIEQESVHCLAAGPARLKVHS